MSRLTSEQLHSRLEFDFRIAKSMEGPLVSVEAYASARDLEKRLAPVVAMGEGRRATYYRVDYGIRSVVGEGKFHDQFVVSMDLLANGNYPYTEPACFVLSRPLPWTPHFAPNLPICLGELWRDLAGHATVGHLIIHVAKLLNFDEPERSPGYVGYNGPAVQYWKTSLKGQPITPGLAYPTLPAELTHGQLAAVDGLFRAARGSGASLNDAATSNLFRPGA